MGNERNVGIYNKYTVVRNDGTGEVGKKHHGCAYFVLDLEHDPYAKPAILAYAKACGATHPVLAKDLMMLAIEKPFKGGRA